MSRRQLRADEFNATFGVGGDRGEIHPGDSVGVMLAAIKGLHDLARLQGEEIASLRSRVRAAEAAAG